MQTEDSSGGLQWDSSDVEKFIHTLPGNQRIGPMPSINVDAKATLLQCYKDGGWTANTFQELDVPSPPDVSLTDVKRICDELDYLPPLCPPQLAPQLSHELQVVAVRLGYVRVAEDSAGTRVMSPSATAVRQILRDTSGELDLAKHVFQVLTDITRLPEGSSAPGEFDGPPARVTIRDIEDGIASTLGEPKHVDVRPSSWLHSTKLEIQEPALMQRTCPPRPLVCRPRLIWTFNTKNPLRITCWRARACIETEPDSVGGGLVVSEHLRCDPPYLHEGMTTGLQGQAIGNRLQLVTDPDWFNTQGARELMNQALKSFVSGHPRDIRPPRDLSVLETEDQLVAADC